MIRKRGNAYQADVSAGGKRKRKQFSTWSAAKAWEDAQLEAGGLSPSASTYSSESLSGASSRLIGVLWGNSDYSFTVRRNLDEVLEVIGDVPVDQFSDKHVEKLINHYRSIGNSNATINRKFACLSKLFRHLHRTRAISFMPYFPRQKEPVGRIRFLTLDEEDRMFHFIRQFSEDHYRLVVFLVDTGARFSEALKLEYRDINKAQRSVTFWETKTNHSRTVYLTDRAYEAVMSVEEGKPPFGSINKWTFRDHWDKARELAGLGHDSQVVPHTLRHTCASRLVQGGMDLRRVQEWLGHRSMQMTMRYAHLAPCDLKLCVDVLERGRGGMVDAAVLNTAS